MGFVILAQLRLAIVTANAVESICIIINQLYSWQKVLVYYFSSGNKIKFQG